MSESPIRNDVASFCTMFTRAIIAWNNAEDQMRYILEGLGETSLGATIAIRQLGNTSLQDAIVVMATFLESVANQESDDQADHLRHLVSGFDILRVYRNFYVHNLRSMGSDPEPETGFSGTLHTIEVKGRYSWVQQKLTIAELREFTLQVMELSEYARGVRDCVSRVNALAAAAGRVRMPVSSLQKPTWPEKLKKNHESLIAPRPQPQSSPK